MLSTYDDPSAYRQLPRCRTTVVTRSASLPLSVATVAAHLRIDDSASETAAITLMVEASAEIIERFTGRALVPATIKSWFSTPRGHLPEDLQLPWLPVGSVDAVATVDTTGTETALATSDYRVLQATDSPVVVRLLSPTYAEPLTLSREIAISYSVGYANEAAIPAGLRLAVLMLAAWQYEHRGDVSAAAMSPVEQLQASGALSAAERYKVWSVI